MNIEDGQIWLNLADGRVNIKREQKPGDPEALTKDYLMSYNLPNVAKVEDDDSIRDILIRRMDVDNTPPPPPQPGVPDVEGEERLKDENHTPKMVNTLLTTLRKYNNYAGDWHGTFWGGNMVKIGSDGHFSIKDMNNKRIVKGDIWVNLKDNTLNFKIPPHYSGAKSNDYFGTYESPNKIKIVK